MPCRSDIYDIMNGYHQVSKTRQTNTGCRVIFIAGSKRMREIFKKRKTVYVIFTMLVMLMAVGLYGIGRGHGQSDRVRSMPSETSKKIGATYMTMNNPYFQDMNAQIEEIVEANGDILIYRDPAQDQKKQNEQIMDMLEEGISAIFLNPVNWETVRPALIACKEAKVPVFVIDTKVYDDEYVAFSILSDNYDAGVQCAQDMMKKRTAARILVIDSPGTKSIEDRVQGFMDTIEGHQEYRVVKLVHGKGELEVSMDVTQEVLAGGTEFDVVLGGNDPTALGALAALQMNQMQEGILIYGIDGSPDGKVMIKEGYMEGSSAQRPIEIANRALEMGYAYLNGEAVEELVIVPVTMITKDNIDEFDLAGWQ